MRRVFLCGLVVALLAVLIPSASAHHKPGHTRGPRPVPTEPPPPTECGPPVAITTGGTYSGCYRSTTGAPAVSIATTEPVVLDHARIEHTGIGLRDADAQGTREHVTIRDTTFQQLPTTLVISHRAIWLENPAAFTSEWSRYIDGDGVIVYGTFSGLTDAPLLFRNNDGIDVGRYPRSDPTGNCCVQMLQLAWFRSASIDIYWNRSVNTPGESDGEDLINLYNSGGSSSLHRADIHHNLMDGSFDRSLSGDDFGTGINVGDAGDAHSTVWDNVVVNVTNGGIKVDELDNWATGNLVVSDGAPQSDPNGQGFIIFQNVDPPGPRATGNRINFHRSPSDPTQYWCWMEQYCADNTIVDLTEDQARAEWEADRLAAGEAVGPR